MTMTIPACPGGTGTATGGASRPGVYAVCTARGRARRSPWSDPVLRGDGIVPGVQADSSAALSTFWWRGQLRSCDLWVPYADGIRSGMSFRASMASSPRTTTVRS